MIFVLTVKHSFNSPVFLFPTIILFVNKNLSYLVIYVLFCLFFFLTYLIQLYSSHGHRNDR